MPRKPTKPDNPEQSQRFIETAEEVGADDEAALPSALSKIVKSPRGLGRQRTTKTSDDQNDR
jgi:hypothetical protein